MRKATVKRVSKETSISATLLIEGTGKYDISTGIRFLDHMLEQLSKHSLIDLKVKAKGDTHIDLHHTTEDTGIAIGEAIKKAAGNPLTDIAGDLTIEQVMKIARMKDGNLTGKTTKAKVKEIIGTCRSAGVMVDGKKASVVHSEIDAGDYDAKLKE